MTYLPKIVNEVEMLGSLCVHLKWEHGAGGDKLLWKSGGKI